VEGRSVEEVNAAVESWIETEMRTLAPHRYTTPYAPLRESVAASAG
jgi:hypothetical protein